MVKRKQRILVCATSEGLKKAEKALIRLGFETKSNFAKAKLISRSTVTKFFQGKPVQVDTLKRICEELTLNWQEIAGLKQNESLSRPGSQQPETSGSSGQDIIDEGTEQVPSSTLQVSVIDRESQRVKAVITLEGDDDFINLALFQTILRSGYQVHIIDMREGSIKLYIEGSPEEINRLRSHVNSGELKQLDDFAIRSIQELNDDSFEEETTKASDKWHLVEEIVNQGAKGRSLESVDLSDADLRGADLRGANLIHANLIHADLSDADLIRADLIRADLIDANLSSANLVYANLSGAKLRGANLRGAKLRGANLIGADLSSADLSSADLIGADLSSANLSSADLSSADLTCAKLSGAEVRNTRFGGNSGISESLNRDLIERGAKF